MPDFFKEKMLSALFSETSGLGMTLYRLYSCQCARELDVVGLRDAADLC